MFDVRKTGHALLHADRINTPPLNHFYRMRVRVMAMTSSGSSTLVNSSLDSDDSGGLPFRGRVGYLREPSYGFHPNLPIDITHSADTRLASGQAGLEQNNGKVQKGASEKDEGRLNAYPSKRYHFSDPEAPASTSTSTCGSFETVSLGSRGVAYAYPESRFDTAALQEYSRQPLVDTTKRVWTHWMGEKSGVKDDEESAGVKDNGGVSNDRNGNWRVGGKVDNVVASKLPDAAQHDSIAASNGCDGQEVLVSIVEIVSSASSSSGPPLRLPTSRFTNDNTSKPSTVFSFATSPPAFERNSETDPYNPRMARSLTRRLLSLGFSQDNTEDDADAAMRNENLWKGRLELKRRAEERKRSEGSNGLLRLFNRQVSESRCEAVDGREEIIGYADVEEGDSVGADSDGLAVTSGRISRTGTIRRHKIEDFEDEMD